MVRTSFSLSFSFPNQISVFTALRNWTRRAFHNEVDLFSQSCYTQIIPGLYLSNARAAADRDVIRRLGITHILTVEARRLPKSVIIDNNISSLFIRAYDMPNTNLLRYFPISNAFIDEGLRNGNVLVHCHFGVSRSATLVIAFLMYKFKLPYVRAYNIVKSRRRFINPNPGFVRQLMAYERANYNVAPYRRAEAFINILARKHKVKIASFVAILASMVIPLAFFIV